MVETVFPRTVLRQLLHAQGAPRVSEDAIVELREYLIRVVQERVKGAASAAQHAQRKTLRVADLTYAEQ